MRYRSYADVGGEAGHGPVVAEMDEPIFHADWERDVMRLVYGMLFTGDCAGDAYRSAFETLPNYRVLSYYQRWLAGLENLLVEHGLAGADEIVAGRMLHPSRQIRAVSVGDVRRLLDSQLSTERAVQMQARFSVGQEVRARTAEVDHHTRLPGYARGKRGRIESVHGAHVFPDTNASGLGEDPQWLYTVVFTGRELWGEGTAPSLTVSINAWEPYLEPMS